MKRIGELGEFQLIKLLTEGLTYDKRTIVGVGDDCCVYEFAKGKYLLATCDILIEDVHFSTKTASPFLIGHKAIAASLSDIAAMGGRPLFALTSVGLPSSTAQQFALELYNGIRSICHEFQAPLIGGDTVRSPDKLVIDVAMLGECPHGKFVLRSGAQPGDVIAVTGTLGDSAAGLHLLNGALSERNVKRRKELIEAHLGPVPRTREGLFLAENFELHSMIDISDGLAGDLGHICESSRLGAWIRADRLPLSNSLQRLCREAQLDPLSFALSGGEDYELLFTLGPQEFDRLESSWIQKFKLPLCKIGEMTADFDGIRLAFDDGTERPLDVRSFDHFAQP